MIYVMSDIHGQKRRFDSVMKQINLQPDDTLYILGDVIDRNPDGIKILRQIMAMPNAKMLLGKVEPDLWALKGLAAALLPVIREFYTREENVQAFEAWLKDWESNPQEHGKRK